MLEELCEAAGFAPDSVCEGEAAYHLLSTMGNSYSLAFIDIHMKGWSGIDAISLFGLLPDTRKFIIIVTGYLDDELDQLLREHPNVMRVLMKPFRTDHVADLLHEAMLLFHS